MCLSLRALVCISARRCLCACLNEFLGYRQVRTDDAKLHVLTAYANFLVSVENGHADAEARYLLACARAFAYASNMPARMRSCNAHVRSEMPHGCCPCDAHGHVRPKPQRPDEWHRYKEALSISSCDVTVCYNYALLLDSLEPRRTQEVC